MNIRDIPVRVIGPGSQPTSSDGDAITYMDMPSDMSTFVAPVMPEPEDVLLMDGAREAMRWLSSALDNYAVGGEPVLADLSALDEESRDVVNQILGEGEVSIVCDGQVRARTQESVLAGVWRTFFFDRDDRVVCDLLEVAENDERHERMDTRFAEVVDEVVLEPVVPRVVVECEESTISDMDKLVEKVRARGRMK